MQKSLEIIMVYGKVEASTHVEEDSFDGKLYRWLTIDAEAVAFNDGKRDWMKRYFEIRVEMEEGDEELGSIGSRVGISFTAQQYNQLQKNEKVEGNGEVSFLR